MSKADCDCITQVNEALKPHGARLALSFRLTEEMVEQDGKQLRSLQFARVRCQVALERIDAKSRKRLPGMMASFCPFCGVALQDEEGP